MRFSKALLVFTAIAGITAIPLWSDNKESSPITKPLQSLNKRMTPEMFMSDMCPYACLIFGAGATLCACCSDVTTGVLRCAARSIRWVRGRPEPIEDPIESAIDVIGDDRELASRFIASVLAERLRSTATPTARPSKSRPAPARPTATRLPPIQLPSTRSAAPEKSPLSGGQPSYSSVEIADIPRRPPAQQDVNGKIYVSLADEDAYIEASVRQRPQDDSSDSDYSDADDKNAEYEEMEDGKDFDSDSEEEKESVQVVVQ